MDAVTRMYVFTIDEDKMLEAKKMKCITHGNCGGDCLGV